MARFFFSVLALVVVSSVVLAPASAQSRTGVRGVVIDAETGMALPGASVYLDETRQGDASRGDGYFEIVPVQPGTYTLIASLIGYAAVTEEITIERGVMTEVELVLTPQPIDLGEILAQADRPFSAASSRVVRAFDLLTKPVRSSQDLLQLAPGLVTAQHAGGGKAEQIFLRGFDADHGTDVAITVDGMPVNMVSHGHGQGYADLHFLIPDLVEEIDVFKGPYAPAHGNLATAGAITFVTRDHLDENLVRVEGGSFGTAGVTALYQIPLTGPHQGAYLAGQFYQTEGPFEQPQDFQRFNLFGKFHTHLGEGTQLTVSGSGFSSAWDASGQVPQRAIEQGLITRFGALDDLEGGTTSRQNLNIAYEAENGTSAFRLQGYASRYTFKLFSNFTYFLEDGERGDMIEQTDGRSLYGLTGEYSFLDLIGTTLASTTLGGGFRADDAGVNLWKSPDRTRLAPLVDAEVAERNLYLWVQEELTFSPLVRLQLGLRGDYFTFDVDDALDGTTFTGLPHASGYAQQSILSPKASLVVSPLTTVDLFFNAGTGFHSNDARAAVLDARVADLVRVYRRDGLGDAEIEARLAEQGIDPGHRGTDTLPRAAGGEVGFRVRPLRRLNVAAALWLLDLEREFVYVGDGGFTELSGQSRRYGLDLEGRLSLTPWLSASTDLNLSRGTFTDEPDDANAVPLAPRVTSTGTLTAMHPSGWESSLRYVHVGDRPANEDGSVTAEGFTVVTLSGAYRWRSLKVSAVLENLFDVDWNEAQFDTESLLRGEAAPVSELHFTPGNPRNVRFGLTYLF